MDSVLSFVGLLAFSCVPLFQYSFINYQCLLYFSPSLSLNEKQQQHQHIQQNMTTKATHSEPNTECCMCGDPGFSDQLFQCKLCQFRSQHRYCSNMYPKPESVGICNWCWSKKEDTKEKSTNSSNSSSSIRNNDDESKSKRIRNGNNNGQNIGVKKGLKGSVIHLQIQKPSKKPKSPESSRSPSASTSPPKSSSVLVSTRKRIVTNGVLEERLRRTRSEDITNRNGATKQTFRNKVRRYKLLDEVSS